MSIIKQMKAEIMNRLERPVLKHLHIDIRIVKGETTESEGGSTTGSSTEEVMTVSVPEHVIIFAVDVVAATKKKVVPFVKACLRHTEAIVLLGTASVGITAILSKIPMAISVPAFINAEMLIPVLAVLITIWLAKSAERRAKKRQHRQVLQVEGRIP